MPYLGQTKTGAGRTIPMLQNGAIDINALIGQMVDRKKTYVFDTYKIAPGATVPSSPIRFFQTPLGQPDPYNGSQVKTELETNMTSAGFFNPPYDMIINNLGFLFLPGARLFDMQQVINMGWIEFKILEKRQWMGNMMRHPPGMGLTGASTQTSESTWNNGSPVPERVWHFGEYKKYIPPMVNFSLTLNFPETYNTFYNSVLPAEITATLGAIGSSLPTLSSLGNGGNGLTIVAFMNGLADGPVQ